MGDIKLILYFYNNEFIYGNRYEEYVIAFTNIEYNIKNFDKIINRNGQSERVKNIFNNKDLFCKININRVSHGIPRTGVTILINNYIYTALSVFYE